MMRTFFLIITLTIIFSANAFAEMLDFTYNFKQPEVKNVIVGYQTINFKNCIQAGKIGEPQFPVKGVALLLPPGKSASNIQVIAEDKTFIGYNYQILPKQPPVAYSSQQDVPFTKNEDIYQQNIILSYLTPEFSTQYANGYSILMTTFSPVEYNPATGELHYFKTIRLMVSTETTPAAQSALNMLKTHPKIQQKIKCMIDNPENIDLYSSENREDEDDYEYLVITQESYEDDLEEFVEFYNRRGIRTKILTTEYIDESYNGEDIQEKIRYCVNEQYLNFSIQYLLLAGDSDTNNSSENIVPHRGFYTTVNSPHGSNDWVTDEDIPADLYYVALDGCWNTDGDNLWGEEDEDDLLPELAVGRICIDSPEEAEVFYNKTTAYQDNPVSGDVTKALMLGEHLYDNPLSWGGDMLDQLIGFCDEDGYETQGIPEDIFEITVKYDRDMGNWSSSQAMSWINNGTHLICHNGHANVHYGMRFDQNQITDSNFFQVDGDEHGFVIPITQGCLSGSIDNRGSWAGWYDNDDSIAEEWLSINNFAVATIANSRYGWFVEGSNDGPGQHLNREFLDAIFAENFTTLGDALLMSKIETAPYVELPNQWEDGALRWNFYCNNLLGDPALDVWTDTPANFTDISYPDEITVGDESVLVQTNVEGALVALYKDGILFARGYAYSGGTAIIPITEEFNGETSVELIVTAHNYLPFETEIPVVYTDIDDNNPPSTPSQFALLANYPNPFNPSTTIAFTIPASGGNTRGVKLNIYDISGKLIKILIDEPLKAGYHSVVWNGKDDAGHDVASGVYFYKLETDSYTKTKSMLLLK